MSRSLNANRPVTPTSFPQPHMGARHMTEPGTRDIQPSKEDVALIIGGGPGISSSCARLFAKNGMSVGIAAETRTNRSCRTWRRRMACVDTRAMQASQRPWSCCLRMLSETSGLLRLSCITSMAGFPASFERELPKPTQVWRSTHFETRRSARSWWVSRRPGSCARTNRTQTAPKERSSSRTQAQRLKASHQAVHLQWHAMPSPDLRKAWRGN